MQTRIQFNGDFHSIIVSPQAKLSIGEGVCMSNFCSLQVDAGAELVIGDRVFFNEHSSLRCVHRIHIGKDTLFGDGVRLYDQNHAYSDYHVERYGYQKGSITIGKNCWIGANCVILKGVTIGDNVIIGAGSVVRQDIPSNSIVYGASNLIIKARRQAKHHVFTLTDSDTLEQLAYLVEHLPDVDFHIAAPTSVSPYLKSFTAYINVQLYTNIHHEDIIDDLLDRADIYLDINHGREVAQITKRATEKNKPVLSFDCVSHVVGGQIYSSEFPETMVESIRDILKMKEN